MKKNQQNVLEKIDYRLLLENRSNDFREILNEEREFGQKVYVKISKKSVERKLSYIGFFKNVPNLIYRTSAEVLYDLLSSLSSSS